MDSRDEEIREKVEFEYLNQDFKRKRYFPKTEKSVKLVLNNLFARKSFSQTLVNDDLADAWNQSISEVKLSGKVQQKTRTANVRNGVLEILVANSSVHQELMFQKRKLLKLIQKKIDTQQITDLRFKIGAIG